MTHYWDYDTVSQLSLQSFIVSQLYFEWIHQNSSKFTWSSLLSRMTLIRFGFRMTNRKMKDHVAISRLRHLICWQNSAGFSLFIMPPASEVMQLIRGTLLPITRIVLPITWILLLDPKFLLHNIQSFCCCILYILSRICHSKIDD